MPAVERGAAEQEAQLLRVRLALERRAERLGGEPRLPAAQVEPGEVAARLVVARVQAQLGAQGADLLRGRQPGDRVRKPAAREQRDDGERQGGGVLDDEA